MINYTDKQRKEIADQEYHISPSQLYKRIYTDPDTGHKFIGYVAEIHYNKNTGENSYIIVDKDPKAKGYKASDVKHVTVLYQGSSTDFIGNIKNAWNDWGHNDAPLAVESIFGGTPTSQMKSGAATLKNTLSTYKNANVDVYGHSLGSSVGQYAVSSLDSQDASRIHGGWFYEGPNTWKLLTPQQQKMADELTAKGLIHNYIDRKDLVPIGYGDDARHIGDLGIVNSKDAGNLTDQHMWKGYRYYDDERLKLVGFLDEASELADTELGAVDDERKALEKNNGGELTSAETIYLDEQEAGAIVNGIHSLAQNEVQQMQEWCNAACAKADEEWQGTRQDAAMVGQNLSADEVLDNLAQGGATADSIAGNPKTQYQSEFNGFKQQTGDFDDLAGKINQAVQTQVSTDQQLAAQLKAIGQ